MIVQNKLKFKAVLPVQGAQVQSLLGEQIPHARTKGCAYTTKTQHSQINYFFEKKKQAKAHQACFHAPSQGQQHLQVSANALDT